MCRLREAISKKRLRQLLQNSIRQAKLQQQSSKSSDEWLEMRVFRIAIFNGPAPEHLKIHFPPRNSATDLHINGKSVRPSASAFQTLRLEHNAAPDAINAATYVNTDCAYVRGKLCFEVCAAEETLLCSAVDRKAGSVFPAKWTLECSCALDRPSEWGEGEGEGNAKKFPSVEVSIVCRSRAGPFMLRQTELLVTRRRRSRCEATLEVIPEGNDYENSFHEENVMDLDISTAAMLCEAVIGKLSNMIRWRQRQSLCYRLVTWVGTGVFLGVGFGVGAFLGLGVGAGLLAMRTYHYSHFGHRTA